MDAMTSMTSADVPEPLRSALLCYRWSGLDDGCDLTEEIQAGLGDPRHWTALLAHQASTALCGSDPGLQAAVAGLAGDRLPTQGWDIGREPTPLDPDDLTTRVAVEMTGLIARFPVRHPFRASLPHEDYHLVTTGGAVAMREPWPAPAGAAAPSPEALLPARLYVCEPAAIAHVWPSAQDGTARLQSAFPHHDPARLMRLTRDAVAAAHLAGIVSRQELVDRLGHRPDPAHPCLLDLPYDGGTRSLNLRRAWHGLPAGDDAAYAVEWARHRRWYLLSQDEDLIALGELGIHNVRAALDDPGCVKTDYIEELLDHLDASCGSPGCLSCPPSPA